MDEFRWILTVSAILIGLKCLLIPTYVSTDFEVTFLFWDYCSFIPYVVFFAYFSLRLSIPHTIYLKSWRDPL